MAKQKESRLGRGLGALIDTGDVTTAGSSSISDVQIDLINPNPNQPRTFFDEEALAELASSIRELGVISPITLRKNADNSYLIIAGERRFRASKLAGLRTIPAYIKTAEDDQVMEMALIENIQREDLDAIEIALAFSRLIEEYQLTQELLSERVGKKRATIANYLRLLRLPAEIQMGIKDKKIDMGHARAILGIGDATIQLKLYEETLAQAYSVRKLEEIVRERVQKKSTDKDSSAATRANNSLRNLKEFDDLRAQLSKRLGGKVLFSCSPEGKGKITIPFTNDEELARIMDLFDKI